MRIVITGLLLAPFLAGCASLSRPTPEAELLERLDGRVAGAPVRCVRLQSVSSVGIIPRTALVYEVGRTLYVNRPNGRERLRTLDTLQVRSFGGELCRGEPVNLIDQNTRALRGFITLGDFVPYRRAD